MTTPTTSTSEKDSKDLAGQAIAAVEEPDLDMLKEAPLDASYPVDDELFLTAEQDAKIRRKIDLNLMPLLCVVYGLQFLDKTCTSYASIMGIREDLHLSLSQYSWLSSIFYIGYLVGEYPMVYLLQRLPLSKFTGICIFIWGGILCCMAACTDFKGVMVVRFFLGFFECMITPSMTTVTAQWYKTREQGTRTGIWASCNAFAGLIGGGIAYGLAKADAAGSLSIPGWQVIFILLGSATAALGVVVFFFLPDSPLTARFLTAEERPMALERLRANQQGQRVREFKRYQVVEALTDPLTWLYALLAVVLNIPNGGVTNFFSILIRGMGFSTLDSLLLGMPGSAIVGLFVVGSLYIGDRYKRRIFSAIPACLFSITGTSLLWGLPDKYRVGRLIGYYFVSTSTPAFFVCLSLLTSNVAGQTKKSTVSAIFLIFYCVGNLIGPQTFRAGDAPRYSPALATVVACVAAALILLLCIWAVYVRENRRRDAICAQPEFQAPERYEFADLTDRENIMFRYAI